MPNAVRSALLVAFVLAPVAVLAQPFEGVGARAQGMAAFVAVADDASAVYWNPGGLASGAYFSLVLDRTEAETKVALGRPSGGRSSWLLALSAPAIGLSYYRLRSTNVFPTGTQLSRVESLVTHHAGATLVHSIFNHLAAGATVKLVTRNRHAWGRDGESRGARRRATSPASRATSSTWTLASWRRVAWCVPA